MTPDDPTDELLAAALGMGASYERAAAIAACSKATVKRRMGDPDFRARVGDLRRDHVHRVDVRLADLSTHAIDALDDLIADRDSPAQRLGAARVVLDGVLRFHEAAEVEDRLAALEARIGARKATRNGAGR